MIVGVRCKQNSNPPSAPAPVRSWLYILPESFLPDFETRLANADVLCIGVFRLNQIGQLTAKPTLTRDQKSRLTNARMNRKIYPLISLTNAYDGAQLLANNSRRAVTTLVALLKEESYDGLHIDFEYLTGRSSDHYVSFLKLLKEHPGMQGKTLSIAANPPLQGTAEQIAFFDLQKLDLVTDEIVFMTYDYHMERAGPVTHLGWAEENMKLAFRHIRPEKVWLGVPAYGYEWKPGSTRPSVLSEAQGLELCKRYGCKRHDSGCLTVNSQGRQVYFADKETRISMRDLAKRLGVRGTALWRVGFEATF
ncbi:MAG: hypothetical protein JNM27_05920 [Leptospirales bacterium]|nr:hypothetical protein [Leptospirales bacterium]